MTHSRSLLLLLTLPLWPCPTLADEYAIDFELPASTATFDKSAWLAYRPADVVFVDGADRASLDSTVAHTGQQSLKVSFPRSAVGPSEGGHQAAIALAPAEEYVLSYWLRFSDDFSWGGADHGGKLPGLAQGKSCSGGDLCDGTNGFTARFMWRKNGAAVLYLYHMDRPGQWGDDFTLVSAENQPLYFTRGDWVHLKQRVKINRGKLSNGEVQVWVNGTEALRLDGLRFVTDGSLVDRIYVSTFHGGNSLSWGPLNDSYIWIDDILVSSDP